MPLTYTTAQGTSAQSTTTSVTTATGTAGDLIIAICMGVGASGCTVPAAPGGTIAAGSWTAVDAGAIGAGPRASSKAYRAVAPSTAAVTVTKPNQAGSSSGLNMLVVYRIANAVVGAGTPSSNEVDLGGTFTPSVGGGTGGVVGGLAIDYACQYTNAATATMSLPAGWTALAQLGAGVTGRGVGRAGHMEITAAGAVPSGTMTSTVSSTSTTWCGQLIVVDPNVVPVAPDSAQFLPFF